ncbi:MFS transporter [Bacillus sp. DX1.1]|uniref:MFS transporter n=1 Tax=unclassified Bacillus (in: firmicutes) TaxID=185979 RepID=UPI0025706D3C|nr:MULTISPECIES: MFS transporter [unclassified Bacillus (in: firmicutes)]MDM5156473.1 MFS transporter [Bacillus sp. DX1.1]WJE80740.1 MFS transporter [Bacillus sp. DX3.1]
MKWKHVIGDVEVNRDLVLLLVMGGLYTLAISLSNTFVNIYLWKQTQNYLNIGLYNLASVVMQPLTFLLAGKLAKRIDRAILLRIGVGTLAAFFIVVLLTGTHASQYILLIGSLLGIGYGFYWLAFNLLTFEITEPETRDFFNGFLGLLTSFSGMIGPIAAGYMISRMDKWSGYTVVFVLSLTLFTIAIVISFFLSKRECEGRYEIVQVLKERKHDKNWGRITLAHFFQGLREGTFIFVISVYVYLASGSEFALGKYSLVNSAVSFVCYYLVARMLKKEWRKKAILLGGIILYAVVFLVVFQVTYVKLLIYAACIAIAYPILLVPYGSMTYDVIGRAKQAKEWRVEYIVVRELWLNGGRICSVLSFLCAVSFFPPEKSLPVLLCILGVGHFLIYFAVRNVKYGDQNRNGTSIPAPETTLNHTEREG